MSSFFPDTKPSLVERLIIRLLRQGQIPAHIGFIMDGNRRYARQRQVEKLIGHSRGFDKLAETLGWCRDLGVRQATIYAFSIENFKRPPDEVAGLMDLFRRQFEKLIEEFPKFDAFQICVRVYGRVDMLPADVQASVAKVVARTAKNDRFYLNVALAYTSRAEICSAIGELKQAVEGGQLKAEEITEETLSGAMYSAGLRDPDILIRTSGEIRLSDFLLWQSAFSYIFFARELWPDFSIWSLFVGILHYQVQAGVIARAREHYQAQLERLQAKKRERQHHLLQNGSGGSIMCNGGGGKVDGGNRNRMVVYPVKQNGLCRGEGRGGENGHRPQENHIGENASSTESQHRQPRLSGGGQLLFAAFLLLIIFAVVSSALFA